MEQLDGKVAVITGAGSGIGRAIALQLAAEGAKLALADIDERGLAETTAQAVAAGTDAANITTHTVDVRLQQSVDALADAVFAQWGRVDVLVNNAGVFVGGVLWERPAADVEFVLGVNLWGILHGIRAFVPRMIAGDTEGHIVNTCSIAGLLGSPFSGPYNISKFAALAATESLALDLAAVGSKLKVTAVCPGMVVTNLAEGSTRTRPDELATVSTDDATFALDVLTQYLTEGIDANDVARQVVAAIHDEQFLVLTHDHHAHDITVRAAQLVANQLPDPGEYR